MSIYIVLVYFLRMCVEWQWGSGLPPCQGALFAKNPSRYRYFDSCRLLPSKIPADDLYSRQDYYVQPAIF